MEGLSLTVAGEPLVGLDHARVVGLRLEDGDLGLPTPSRCAAVRRRAGGAELVVRVGGVAPAPRRGAADAAARAREPRRRRSHHPA
ncbi:MAG: hypothetical protein M9894_35375 [Planctomycetes bacterium]|nr:hypothetical protein [Planctomycetota bacterium]